MHLLLLLRTLSYLFRSRFFRKRFLCTFSSANKDVDCLGAPIIALCLGVAGGAMCFSTAVFTATLGAYEDPSSVLEKCARMIEPRNTAKYTRRVYKKLLKIIKIK